MSKMPEESLAKTIIKRQKQLEDIRSPWLNLWQDIADYVVPIRSNIKGTQQQGTKRTSKIFDGSPIAALELFADGLHGYLISPSIQWFRLRMADVMLGDIPEVKEWLQETEKCLYAAFQRSNFYNAMSEYFIDGGSIGTAILHAEEDIGKGKIIFGSRHPKEICIAENQYGEVDTVFRKCTLQTKQAVEKFGLGNLTNVTQSQYENNPFQSIEFIHAVYPREGRDQSKLDQKNKPFASVWVQPKGEHLVLESGYNNNPYSVWRYKKGSDETYGRSPASTGLAEIIGLNLIAKSLLRAGELAVDPAYNVPAELKGSVKITPHGMNYYDDPKSIISAVHTGINFPVGLDREDKKRRIIEEHFKVDFFLMLSRAEKIMTATEIIEKQGEKAAILGTAIARLNSECLNPTIDQVFEIEYTAGRIPPPPAILLEREGGQIDIDYLGPLAQAQKRLFQTQGITRSLEGIKPILDINPETKDIVDWDETGREILQSYGMPQKIIKSIEDVLTIRQQRAEAQRRTIAKEDLAQMIQHAKTLAETDKASDGTIAELIKSHG